MRCRQDLDRTSRLAISDYEDCRMVASTVDNLACCPVCCEVKGNRNKDRQVSARRCRLLQIAEPAICQAGGTGSTVHQVQRAAICAAINHVQLNMGFKFRKHL